MLLPCGAEQAKIRTEFTISVSDLRALGVILAAFADLRRVSCFACLPDRLMFPTHGVPVMPEPLEREIATYERERQHLESEHHGKFVLIHGDEVVDVYDSFPRAAEEGTTRFGSDPFLVRQIGAERPKLSPAILYGLIRANRNNPIQS